MVEYKGQLISKNSEAYKMWIAHLYRLKKEAKKSGDYYEK